MTIHLYLQNINNLCNITSSRLGVLTRIKRFLPQEQAKRLPETYRTLTFKYYPLPWMFCGETENNNSINKTQKRNLRLIQEIENATFENLLERDESNSTENNMYTHYHLKFTNQYII